MRATEPDPLPAETGTILAELLARAEAAPAGLEGLRDRVVVVKYGGAAMGDRETMERWARDLILMQAAGVRVAVTHGGGPALTSVMKRMGVESTFHDGHRVTDGQTAEIAEMVLSGSINKSLVSLLQRAGGRAVGLSGTDGGMIGVEPHRPGGTDLGFVGRVARVETELLLVLLDHGFIPVVSSTAADVDGQPHNINADLVTGALAAALDATAAVFLSDVAGVIVEGRLQTEINASRAAGLIRAGTATGGMRPKLEAALAALAGGVDRIHLIDGRAPHAMVRRLIGGHEIGTTLLADMEDGS